MNANSNLNPKSSTKRDVPTSSSTSISVTNNSAATSQSSSIVSSAGETEKNESDDKSYASLEQKEIEAAGKEQTNRNHVECWAVPLQKLNKDLDALTEIVRSYREEDPESFSRILHEEDPEYFSWILHEEDPESFLSILQAGFAKLTSTTTFSRAFQKLPVGEEMISNTAVALYDEFKSAMKNRKLLTEEEKKVFQQRKELSDLEVERIKFKMLGIQYDNQIKKSAIKDKIQLLKDSMCKQYNTIAIHLRTMSNLSQSNAVTAPSYSTIQDSGFDELVENKMITPGEWKFFEDAKPVKKAPSGFKDITNVGTLNTKLLENLKEFNRKFQNYVNSAKPLIKKETHIEEFVKNLQSSNEVASNHGDSTYYPDIKAEEVACVQPFLKGLLCALGNMASKADWDTSQCHTHSPSTKSSPTKSNVQSNRIIPPTNNRHKRIIDKSLSANNRYIFLFRDDCIEIPVEVKPGKRKNMSLSELIVEGKNQILGHLAKHVSVGFNFMGIGIDTKATGVVITPCSVDFVQLCLENIGTPDASLAIYETGPLPLLSAENYSVWIRKENVPKAKKKPKKERTDIAFEYNTESAANDVPLGLVALAKLMTMERKDLMGHSAQFECGEEKDLHGEKDDLLAWGSFSLIYKCPGKDGKDQCVKKISRYALDKVLENEKQVLQKLEKISNVVKLQDCEKVKIIMGTAFERVPSLTLTPLGLKIELYLLNLKNNEKDRWIHSIKEIRAKLRTALESIHEEGYVHNDISPKNIIVHGDEPYLIDFGIASKNDTEIKGFRGTPHFTAKSIFEKYPAVKWTPEFGFDFCALALSMAWLVGQINNESKTWDSFQPCSFKSAKEKASLQNWAKLRYQIAESNFAILGDDCTEWANDIV